MILPVAPNPHSQPRRLKNVAFITERMRKASRQQWNVLELLYLTGSPMPLLGSWHEQRAVRGLVRRQMVVAVDRTPNERMNSIKFTADTYLAILEAEQASNS